MNNRKFETIAYEFDNLDKSYQSFLVENDNLQFTNKVFAYYGVSKSTFRPIVFNHTNQMEYVVFNTRWGCDVISYTGLNAYFHQIRLPKSDISWQVSELGQELYYSTGNAKIQLAGKRQGLSNPISFGLPSVLSCFDAGDCVEYCYAENVNSVYLSTLKMALHNYYMVMNSTQTELVRLFNHMVETSKTELVRIDDTGDIVNATEFIAIVQVAIDNPDVIFYTYTKSTAIVYNYMVEFGQLPSNFKVNISSTNNERSTTYATKLVREFSFITCYILETATDIMAWQDAGMPWNETENGAISNSADFAIALHGTFKKNTSEFNAANAAKILELQGIETC